MEAKSTPAALPESSANASEFRLGWRGFGRLSQHHPFTLQLDKARMLVSLTVGKVDAGVAVLLTEDKRLVMPPCSFPLPPNGIVLGISC